MNFHELAITILLLNHGPISKVRFARTIYFVHKELIRKGIMKSEDIAYIRSPLGPVPEGFMRLAIDIPSIISQKISSSLLSYESEEYAMNDLVDKLPEQHREVAAVIEKVLDMLKLRTTPELVEASHDPSWRLHRNGARYFISAADLRNIFPFPQIRIRIKIKRPASNEIGALQATLVRGMISDIVKESTDLEYPDQPPEIQLTPPKLPFLKRKSPAKQQPPSATNKSKDPN